MQVIQLYIKYWYFCWPKQFYVMFFDNEHKISTKHVMVMHQMITVKPVLRDLSRDQKNVLS